MWAISFPILAFVVGGFEHCVANMFYIPAGLLAAQNPEYVQKVVEAYGMSTEAIQLVAIADFAREHGYIHLMPALCNPDYPMMEAAHGGLIRQNTFARGGVCDYWIVGDKSPYLKEHLRKTDEEGYWCNE